MKRIVAIVAATLIALTFSGCSQPTPKPTPTESSPAQPNPKVRLLDGKSNNPKIVRTDLFVENTDSKPISISCNVFALDADHNQVGFINGVTTFKTLPPGGKDLIPLSIPITVGKAKDVSLTNGQCSAKFEDSALSFYQVSDVTDCSEYFSDTKSWVWGPCFKIQDLDPMTQVTCHVLAIDDAGFAFLVMDYSGNVLMDHSVGLWGDFSLPKTTKENVKKIKSYEFYCLEKI